jgi:general secretion pathway protein G
MSINYLRRWSGFRRRHPEFGFTLIELLIVIVILGILAAIVVFSLGGVVGQSTVAACQSDVNTVENAIQYFVTENNGDLPTSKTEFTTPQTSANGATITYLDSWPSSTRYMITWVGAADGTSGTLTVALTSSSTSSVLTYGEGGAVTAVDGNGGTSSTPAAVCAGV